MYLKHDTLNYIFIESNTCREKVEHVCKIKRQRMFCANIARLDFCRVSALLHEDTSLCFLKSNSK